MVEGATSNRGEKNVDNDVMQVNRNAATFSKKRKKKKKPNEKPTPSPQNKIEFILIVRALAVCQVAWKGKDDFLSGF